LFEILQRALDVEGRQYAAFGMVLLGKGCAEEGHDAVAHELRDGSAISVHCLAHQFEARAHDVVRFLGVESLGHAGEAGDVAEEDSDDLTAVFGRSVAGTRRYARWVGRWSQCVSWVSRGCVQI